MNPLGRRMNAREQHGDSWTSRCAARRPPIVLMLGVGAAVCLPVAAFVLASRSWQPLTVLTLGLTLTGIIVTFLLDYLGRTARAEQPVVQRTAASHESEEQLHAILKCVQTAVVIIEADTQTIVHVNRAAEVMIGAPREAIVGRTCHKFICPANQGQCPIINLGHTVDSSERVLLTADGRHVAVLKTVVPVTLNGRRHLLESFADITDRKHTEEALRAAHAQLHQIFNAAVPLCVIDVDKRLRQANDAFCDEFGVTRADILGKTCREAMPCLACDPGHCPFHDIPDRPERFEREVEKTLADGRTASFLVAATPFHSPDGEWIGFVESFVNVTQRKRAEESLAAACREAEAANEAKNAFLANMSHELRTPLHGILSFAAFGLKRVDTASAKELREYFELIQQSGETLLNLVSDLLDLSRLETGRMEIRRECVDLRAIVPRAVNEFRSMASDRRLDIEYVESEGNMSLSADQTRIAQVIRNLLGNAIQFSPDGGRIEIAVARRDSFVVVTVRDHGIGIPKQELEAVFDKFIQSSKTRSGAGGTGLGLAICREIVAAHGGRIWAEAPDDGGARLVVELPVEQTKTKTLSAEPRRAGAAPPLEPLDNAASLVAGRP
jgi:PAS domain S-box-containing protein